jgi:TPR repeat protein
MANAYANGKYVPRDNAKALSLWKQAAENGERTAIGMLYQIYRKGWPDQNLKPNSTLWKKYLQMGVDQEAPDALTTMGYELIEGKNWSKDTKRGLALLTKSAEKGHISAMNHLGSLYSKGKDVQKNEMLGLWYSTEALTQGKKNVTTSTRVLPKRKLSSLMGISNQIFSSSSLGLPGDPYKPYSLLGVYNSPYEDELAAIKKAKRLKTDTETKVYVAEMAHLLNAPAVWLSPDLRTLERFTRSNTASFDRYLPTLRKKLPAH